MKRIAALDYARGFTALFMAPVHAMLLYSRPEVRETLLGKFFAFVSEWHGAQVFMLLMGVSFSLSPKKDYRTVFARAVFLLLLAYLLNVFKFVLPYWFGWLPPLFLNELLVDHRGSNFFQLIFIGDILHFAWIALFILYFVSRLEAYQKYALVIAALACFFSPLFWDLGSS